ncbi:proline-, glutamic acid- and leucine-rich protein 1 [Cocos nucifera]|uniref:Proline-, glutamic acid- and leucine-rich protein 1 n=1 Tax=Cocos nucifera TaxID=13894 RepID=A0A8K0NBT8_COCNU|nr:proline-, glutamic acid- and leucine-rich protein 1 [Cocos nucifera]
MAVTDFLEGMNDYRLRPRMLRSLVRDRLPDEKRPFPSPAELSSILAYVKTHGLLSERLADSSDGKLIEAWKSAVDAWVDRVLFLVSSNMPDKCWAGTCLLGVTCEECSSDRFIASYSLWFQKLLSNIQPSSSTHFVKVASCASLADLFTRSAGFPSLKKDTTSFAGRLVQPVLQLLNNDGAEAVWEGAVDLLCTLITFYRSSLHRHYDNVEAILASKIMSAKCNMHTSKKFAHCLALLPKVKGDEDSWSLMMQKILITIDMLLNDAFQGLEEAKSSEVVRLLVPPGKDPPPLLGGHLRSEEASQPATKVLHELLVPIVCTLIHCCCMMLSNPYPVQVTVPVRPLLALVGRVLRVDGSLPKSLLLFTTVMHQEILCSELPELHLASLDLLIATIKGVRSQLLPHAANIVRLLTEYFRRATLPNIRIRVYSIMQILLISMGVGMALYLAQEVINNAFADLKDSPESSLMFLNLYSSKVGSETLKQSSPRKRKHTSGSPRQHLNSVDPEVAAISRKPVTPLPVKIAALKTLEALLTVGGSLRSECWRPNVDLLLINVAKNACDMGLLYEGKSVTLTEEPTMSRADFQLAALQALLASLLSQAHVRPPYLSEGLELFRRGKLETGTTLSTFCAHALLALEVLIHPRALPLVDFSVAKSLTLDKGFNERFPENTFVGNQKANMPSLSKGGLGCLNDLEDDEQYFDWLGSDEEAAADGSNLSKHNYNADQPVPGLLEDSLIEKDAGVHCAGGKKIVEGSQERIIDVEMECFSKEENMVESNIMEEPSASTYIGAAAGSEWASPNKNVVSSNGMPLGKEDMISSDAADLSNIADKSKNFAAGIYSGDVMVPGRGDLAASSASNLKNDAYGGLTVWSKGKELMDDSDSVSLDSLPDIVDGDPDTD